MEFETTTTMVSGRAILVVSGDLDMVSAASLRERLAELEATHLGQIIVDLNAATFLDSTGLGELVSARRRADTASSDLPVVCTNDRITKVLRITGLDTLFPLYDSRDEALRGADLPDEPAGQAG